jgi:hypothetical protein
MDTAIPNRRAMETWKWLTKHRRTTILEMFFKDFILVLSSPYQPKSRLLKHIETLYLNLAIKDGKVVDLPQIWS